MTAVKDRIRWLSRALEQAKAMPECYADYCRHADVQGYVEGWRVGVAKDAYETADAILAAREGV